MFYLMLELEDKMLSLPVWRVEKLMTANGTNLYLESLSLSILLLNKKSSATALISELFRLQGDIPRKVLLVSSLLLKGLWLSRVYCVCFWHVLLVFLLCHVFSVLFWDSAPTCPVTSWISLSSSTTPVLLISLLIVLISFSCHLFASHQLSVSPPVFKFSLPFVPCLIVTKGLCERLCLINWIITLLFPDYLPVWEVVVFCVFPSALPALNFWIVCALPFWLFGSFVCWFF